MMSTNYKSTARAKSRAQRPRLVSLWALSGFALLVLIPLAMAFPKQDLLKEARQARLGDALAVSYMANLLRTDPHNLELRMLLAEHKLYLGELAGVPELIEPVQRSANRDWRMKGSLAMYKYLTRQYAVGEQGSGRQTELMKRRHDVFLQVAAYPWPVETLIYLAGQATTLHERDIGVRLYRTITESSKTYSPAWCAETAAHLLGERDYRFAAELYFIARDREPSLAGQREYLIAGIRALLSNNMFSQAMQAADQHLGSLESDPETLEFLVKAARASNDQKRAARYARLMLRLSWLERAYAWFKQADLNLIASASAAPITPAPAALAGAGAYDAKKYQLAYDVFLENRNLDEAYRVAESAVRQKPKEVVWHKQLAQVAEWVNKPEIALREWVWVLRHHGGETAMLAVLRLAPALDDYDATLEAWKYKAAGRRLSEEQWNVISDLFEKTGQPREGIKYFEARYNADHIPLLLEIPARLAQRAGDDEYAINLYLRLLKTHGFNADWQLKIANLYLQRGQQDKAYELLKKNRDNADKKDVAYWKLLAELAWQLQRDDDAVKEYRRLADTGNMAWEEFSRLSDLLSKSKPEEVASLAEAAYRKSGDLQMLIRALEIHSARHDLVAQKRLFEKVAADPKAALSDNSRFLLLRAQYLQESGAFQGARAVFRRAAELAPYESYTVNAFLWFLIEAHDQTALREMMAQVTARGDQQNPAYWGTFAAAYQVLNQPSRAVAYYTRQLQQGGQDFLWLMNYADALDEDRQPGMALRVRDNAWSQLRGKLNVKPDRLQFTPDMLVAARLAMMNRPGDPSLALVRSVLRQDRLVKTDAVTDSKISELILGWEASKEQSPNAKAWLWQRYGMTLSRPLWNDTKAALAENDKGRLAYLLAEQGDGMPTAVRHDAASTLEQVRYAQSIAFDGLSADPEDDEAHLRLTEDAVATAGFVNYEIRKEKLADAHRTVQNVQVESPVSSNLRLAVEARHTRQTDSSLAAFGTVPSNEKIAGVALKIHSIWGDTEFGARRRSEFAKTTEARASHRMVVLPRIQLQFDGEINGEAIESNALRVFGMRNLVDATVHYAFTKREYLRAEPVYARYYTQTGNLLGSGKHFSWELGHQIIVGYPELRIGAIGIHERFAREGGAPLLLPPDQNLYGLCFGHAEGFERPYTKAWLPTFDACATNNDLGGNGYMAKLGLTGSVAGHDQLTFSLSQGHGGVRIVDGLERELKANYRYFFD